MESSTNPFADEPLPVKGTRLESAANPLNPYAAPATAEDYKTTSDIGIWRDGSLLVMHLEATFPSRCLLTGEEAAERRGQVVQWYYPIDWHTRTLPVDYGLSRAALNRIRWRRNTGLCVAVIAALVLIVPALIPDSIVPALVGWLLFACVVALIAGLHHCLDAGRVLRFRKVKYPYLWLTGAGSPFLNTLPQWPGSG